MTDEPSATAPPPVRAEPAVTVTLLLAGSAFSMLPASFAFVMPRSLTRSASASTTLRSMG